MARRTARAVHADATPLTRARVVASALGFIDDHGLAEATMRRLGAHLGVDPMLLYRHVPSRDALLDGVVDLVIDEVLEAVPAPEGPGSWQEHLRATARAVRTAARDHPHVFPLVATRPPEAPWLRPPLRSVRWVEVFLVALLSSGFSAAAAVAAYRAFTGFLLGHLLLEVSAAAGPGEESGEGREQDLDEAPHVQELAALLQEDRTDAEFEQGLDDVLERIARTLEPQGR